MPLRVDHHGPAGVERNNPLLVAPAAPGAGQPLRLLLLFGLPDEGQGPNKLLLLSILVSLGEDLVLLHGGHLREGVHDAMLQVLLT